LGDSLTWAAAGNDWPQFNLVTYKSFADVEIITSPAVTSANNAYAIKTTEILNADTVLYGLYSPEGVVVHKRTGTESIPHFSPEEVNHVGIGYCYIQIIALNQETQYIAGKQYAVLNQTVRLFPLEIIE
jgi:hypothetical protein